MRQIKTYKPIDQEAYIKKGFIAACIYDEGQRYKIEKYKLIDKLIGWGPYTHVAKIFTEKNINFYAMIILTKGAKKCATECLRLKCG
jgi:hypothetical protein